MIFEDFFFLQLNDFLANELMLNALCVLGGCSRERRETYSQLPPKMDTDSLETDASSSSR